MVKMVHSKAHFRRRKKLRLLFSIRTYKQHEKSDLRAKKQLLFRNFLACVVCKHSRPDVVVERIWDRITKPWNGLWNLLRIAPWDSPPVLR